VVPELAQPSHLPAALGDAEVVDQQRERVARSGVQVSQQQRPGLTIEQVGGVPVGVAEEIAPCGTVPVGQQGGQALGESVNNPGRPCRRDTGTTRTRINQSRPCRHAKGNSPPKKHSV
jgi:hypothetical protein